VSPRDALSIWSNLSGVKRWPVVIGACILVLAIVGCVTSNTPTAPTATPTDNSGAPSPIATATPTERPATVPSAAPMPEATAKPSSSGLAVPVMTRAELSLIDQNLTKKGYMVITPLAYKSNTADGFSLYHGRITKAGYGFAFSVIQADSYSHAQGVFETSVTFCKNIGYVGSVRDDWTWYGTKTSDSGALKSALVMPPTESNLVMTVFVE